MELLTSRKNQIITHLKNLSAESAYRFETGEFICDGARLLKEAIQFKAEILCVLWAGEPAFEIPERIRQFTCSHELMQYVSPLKNSRGPLFSVKIPSERRNGEKETKERISSVIVLENVQDPGNVGTVIRTADALGTGAVILVGECADLYNPKTIRATMGGIFRQTVFLMNLEELKNYVNQNNLHLYGAALSEKAEDIRRIGMDGIAVAVGSEGRGLTKELLDICEGQLIIPMKQHCESMNAAIAASIIMWEMTR